tara:strand:- start:3616 stop:3972 length:357 start_codon:yes stop_codon:yes gene_type:complete
MAGVTDWTTVLSKTHLDEGTDDPSQARTQLEAVIDIINDLLESRGIANGLADLGSDGKVVTDRLTNVIGTDQLVNLSVNNDKIASQAVTFDKFKATITSDKNAPTGGSNGDMHFIYLD